MLLKASADSEAGHEPAPEVVEALVKYNESMSRAGVLLDVAGLHPSSRGARVQFRGSQRTITDGPFTEAKELIAGFWMIQVKSRAEAIEWARRCPLPGFDEESEIELRLVYDAAECPVQQFAAK